MGFLDSKGLAHLWDQVKGYVDGRISREGSIPAGAIVIWSGTADNIPDGWALCDGEDGRPDLRDKFVLGAGDYEVGEAGGSETATLAPDNMPPYYTLCYITKIDTE